MASIQSLEKHLAKVRGQLASPSSKHAQSLPEYRAWAELEIKRTERAIEKLRLGSK